MRFIDLVFDRTICKSENACRSYTFTANVLTVLIYVDFINIDSSMRMHDCIHNQIDPDLYMYIWNIDTYYMKYRYIYIYACVRRNLRMFCRYKYTKQHYHFLGKSMPKTLYRTCSEILKLSAPTLPISFFWFLQPKAQGGRRGMSHYRGINHMV